MALQKTPININFSNGVDTKSDNKQIPIGKFLALQNTVFDKAGALIKRNGFRNITDLPNQNQTTITTLNDNLLATGSNLYAYSKDTNLWQNQGIIQPIQLSTLPLVRSTTQQTSPDMAIAQSGLACTVYMDGGSSYYQISDSTTGQLIVNRTALPATATNPRVFTLNRYFMILFTQTVTGNPTLRYIAIPVSNPATPGTPTTISSILLSLTAGYDAYVTNNTLFVGWHATATNVRLLSITDTLIASSPVVITSAVGDLISVTAEFTNSTNAVWITYWDTTANNAYTACYSSAGNFLNLLLAPTLTISSTDITELTSVSQNGMLTIFYEVNNAYSFTPNAKTDFVRTRTVTTTGVLVGPTTILRSVGLASKPFIDPSTGVIYILTAYGEINQPTYFLIDYLGNIYMRLAYSNGGGYATTQVLPSVSILNNTFHVPYLIKNFLAAVNKNTNLPTNTPSNALYTQTGINLAKFTINSNTQYSSEIANALHLTGGQLWEYDGVKPVEHGFYVYPENMVSTTVTGAGNITANTYYYVFTYEWTDNAGNLHRSAPSIPIKQITTTASSTNTINVPTLRLTYKTTPNSVNIVGYRWSLTQQTYYQFTSITTPYVNDLTADSIAIIDTLSDAQILGQTLLYTTGGVIENIAAPSFVHTALFKNRLFGIDAENQNLLWYSKQVVQNTPLEMSDLLTVYVAPTSGAQGSTGPMKALSAMDDKLIIFKKDAIYYLTGNGPDNTGANNDFQDPIFITSAVGCSNPNSIVLMPNGIMFQSDKGIWILSRDLSTSYIGAPVQQYNDVLVVGAEVIPGTNEVRFILNNNITLMYDFYYNQWGTFNNTFAISSTLYQGFHTYLNSYGKIFQQTTDSYLDGSEPVLLSFTTGWINAAGVQGYERFYEMYLLGTYYTPFKLNVQLAYDYNSSAEQATIIEPDNYAPTWGNEAQWGSGQAWGGPGNVFEVRLFPQKQKCESFQITINEIYDPSFGVQAGQGLSLSGMNVIMGLKKGYRTNKASQSFG